MPLSLQFLGAARVVTGSKTILRINDKMLLIDCGLFQGPYKLREHNWDDLPVDPADIDAVIITHAHLDHTGYLPLLVKHGYTGNIYGSYPTLDIARIILADSGKIQEEDAERRRKKHYIDKHNYEPLYTSLEAEYASKQFVPVEDGKWINLWPGVRYRLIRNGHILGSCAIQIETPEGIVVFSGDVGRPESILLETPELIHDADYLILESTYGDRLHPHQDTASVLADVINTTFERAGTVIIPSFAVERAQELMYVLDSLRRTEKIPNIPVYVDSPMAVDVSHIMCRHYHWHKLEEDQCLTLMHNVKLNKEYRNTLELLHKKNPKIVLVGSGMMEGGRVFDYLEAYIGDETATFLQVGYQAEGTLGRALQEGEKNIHINDTHLHVRADIRNISSLSGHADYEELLDWLSGFKKAPHTTFLNHGEFSSAKSFRNTIHDRYGWNIEIPREDEIYRL